METETRKPKEPEGHLRQSLGLLNISRPGGQDETLMIGRTISHYKILEKLGEGGMGVVYKARDTKLDRDVAIKFLPPHLQASQTARMRFIHEAKAAAALNHPNICGIYEIGEAEGSAFIVLEYVEGRSLKDRIASGPLNSEEAVGIGIQIAMALAEAHKKRMVHRDIKPANIMLTGQREVKVLDFGLAKLEGWAELTKTGSAVGTVAYMSPEQTKGKGVDHRTDIWSLGTVLYEMVTGLLPFRGDYEQAIIYSILNEDPVPIGKTTGVPGGLREVILKALSKNPDERYQEAGDILAALKTAQREAEGVRVGLGIDRGVGTSGSLRSSTGKEGVSKEAEASIAVLPFANLSADPEQEYFCDGMAEEIINALTSIRGLHVVARTSAFMFKDKREDIREIGKKLNVKTVLEGSVRKSGKRIRITAQLVNVADGYHLWSRRYDREMEDVFAIHDEISMAMVDELKGSLLGGEKAAIARRHTSDPEAYNSYLKGRYHWNKRTAAGFKRGIEHFQDAIERDPTYALAYAGVADCYNLLGWYCLLSPKEAFPMAKAAAEKALEMHPDLAEALTSKAFAMFCHDWDWTDVERTYMRAIELSPAYGTAHHWYAEYLLFTGRTEEALAEARRALELDPLSMILHVFSGLALYISSRFDLAIEKFRKTIEMDPNFMVAHWGLGLTYIQRGQAEEAVREFQKAIDILGASSLLLQGLGHAYAALGKREEVAKVLHQLEEMSEAHSMYVSPYHTAVIHLDLGELDEAFCWLENAYEEHDFWVVYLKSDPVWKDLRSDRRYVALLEKMGLEP